MALTNTPYLQNWELQRVFLQKPLSAITVTNQKTTFPDESLTRIQPTYYTKIPKRETLGPCDWDLMGFIGVPLFNEKR